MSFLLEVVAVEEELEDKRGGEFNRVVEGIRESDTSCVVDTTTKSVLYDFRRRSDFKNIKKCVHRYIF